MIKELKTLFSLEDEQLNLLELFMKSVLEENNFFNLTSITNEKDFIIKHLKDSLFLSKFLDLNNKSILDFGTGAGIPGIPLSIMFPQSHFLLIDSNNKKINFINKFIRQINIKNVQTSIERVEEHYEFQFDIVISRAVGKLNIMLELCCNIVKLNGLIIFYKGNNVLGELPINQNLIEKELGLKFIKIEYYEFDGNKHSFVFYKKVNTNKRIYPRNFSTIKKKPIF